MAKLSVKIDRLEGSSLLSNACRPLVLMGSRAESEPTERIIRGLELVARCEYHTSSRHLLVPYIHETQPY
jgi:hypothetical protein